ncbi:hypothetical protein C8R43DRAFT_1195016 [Mycena crocata]|nr:hypothetical protein C8R43DRAFT_1195016 [Mycena crocata]
MSNHRRSNPSVPAKAYIEGRSKGKGLPPAFTNLSELWVGRIIWCDPQSRAMYLSVKSPELPETIVEGELVVTAFTTTLPHNLTFWVVVDGTPNPITKWNGGPSEWVWAGVPAAISIVLGNASIMCQDDDSNHFQFSMTPIAQNNHTPLLNIPLLKLMLRAPFEDDGNDRHQLGNTQHREHGPSPSQGMFFPQAGGMSQVTINQYSQHAGPSNLPALASGSHTSQGMFFPHVGGMSQVPVNPYNQAFNQAGPSNVPAGPLIPARGAPPTRMSYNGAVSRGRGAVYQQAPVPAPQNFQVPVHAPMTTQPAQTMWNPVPEPRPPGFTEPHPTLPGLWRNPQTGYTWHASGGIRPHRP